MSDDEFARVNMEWPKGLKEEIREKVGPRGMTEFTLDALRIHLTQDGYEGVAEGLREAKALAQRLANVMVLAADPAARMQFLMSAEFPDWIDMSTWPPELLRQRNEEISQRMHASDEEDEIQLAPEPEPEPEPAPSPMAPQPVGQVTMHRVDAPKEPEPEPEPAIVQVLAEEPVAKPAVVQADRTDLFARLKESGALAPASSLPKPDPKPVTPEPEPEPEPEPPAPPVPEVDIRADIESPPTLAGQPNPFAPADAIGPDPFPAASACPKGCGELIDGECWGCGYVA